MTLINDMLNNLEKRNSEPNENKSTLNAADKTQAKSAKKNWRRGFCLTTCSIITIVAIAGFLTPLFLKVGDHHKQALTRQNTAPQLQQTPQFAVKKENQVPTTASIKKSSTKKVVIVKALIKKPKAHTVNEQKKAANWLNKHRSKQATATPKAKTTSNIPTKTIAKKAKKPIKPVKPVKQKVVVQKIVKPKVVAPIIVSRQPDVSPKLSSAYHQAIVNINKGKVKLALKQLNAILKQHPDYLPAKQTYQALISRYGANVRDRL